MNFQEKVAAVVFSGAAAASISAIVIGLNKQQEIELAKPHELAQVFKCVQPINDGQFNERSASLMLVRDSTGKQHYEVQFDKTAPPPPGHNAWSPVRDIIGDSKASTLEDGVKTATDYCLSGGMPRLNP